LINDAGNASPTDQVFWNFIDDQESPVTLTSSQKDAIAQAMTSIDPIDSAPGNAFCGHLTSLNQVLRSSLTDAEADAIMRELQKHDVAYKNVASLMEVTNFLEDGTEILNAGAVYDAAGTKTVPTPQEVMDTIDLNWSKSDLYTNPSYTDSADTGTAAAGFDATDSSSTYYNIIMSAVTTAPDAAVVADETTFRTNLVAYLMGADAKLTTTQTNAQTCVDNANGAPQIYKDRLFPTVPG